MVDTFVKLRRANPRQTIASLWEQLTVGAKVATTARAGAEGTKAIAELAAANSQLANAVTSLARLVRQQDVPVLPKDDPQTALEMLKLFPKRMIHFSEIVVWMQGGRNEEGLADPLFSSSDLRKAGIERVNTSIERPLLRLMGLLSVVGKNSGAKWRLTDLGQQVGNLILKDKS